MIDIAHIGAVGQGLPQEGYRYETVAEIIEKLIGQPGIGAIRTGRSMKYFFDRINQSHYQYYSLKRRPRMLTLCPPKPKELLKKVLKSNSLA